MMKADLILAADLHLREDTPQCRTDNYLKAQRKKLQAIENLREENNCSIIVAGDLFNRWNPSLWFMSWVLANLPKNISTVLGQHDLKNHNPDTFSKTACSLLESAGRVLILDKGRSLHTSDPRAFYSYMRGYWYGEKPENPRRTTGTGKKIAVAHIMTWQKKRPFPGCKEDNARKLLKRLSAYDLIVTGDNHIPFVEKYQGRLLVNPGSMMRMKSDQIDHKPRVYLYYAKTNSVEPFYLPISQGVVSREHIDKKEERDERISAFVESLEDSEEISLSFEKNLKKHMSKNQTSDKVKKIVWELVEV